jgi:hypothetical protein
LALLWAINVSAKEKISKLFLFIYFIFFASLKNALSVGAVRQLVSLCLCGTGFSNYAVTEGHIKTD